MHKLFFICVMLMFFNMLHAQKCTFSFKGNITDFHDNSSLAGASVHIVNLNKFTSSNLDGNFEFDTMSRL